MCPWQSQGCDDIATDVARIDLWSVNPILSIALISTFIIATKFDG